jgi:hypothetical protein
VLEKLVFRLLPWRLLRLGEFPPAIRIEAGGMCAPTSKPFGASRILSNTPKIWAYRQKRTPQIRGGNQFHN